MGTYCVRAIGLFQAGPAKSKNLKNVLLFFNHTQLALQNWNDTLCLFNLEAYIL